MRLPPAVPEIPVVDLNRACAYYATALGFNVDWKDESSGIAGISRDACRLFLAARSFREQYGNTSPILIWLNLQSKAEVDESFALWRDAGAKILAEPEDKPWKLREFVVSDLDGNLLRVFFDFGTASQSA